MLYTDFAVGLILPAQISSWSRGVVAGSNASGDARGPLLASTEPAERSLHLHPKRLKWPTTAGPATDALLEVLHERVPGAPGKEAGLDATVAWVAATYPDIDLDSPPTYPASGSTGSTW